VYGKSVLMSRVARKVPAYDRVVLAAAAMLAVGVAVQSGPEADPVHVHPTASTAATIRFRLPVNLRVDGHPVSLAIGDFSGDGRPDLAAASRFSVSVLLAASRGRFRRARVYPVHGTAQSVAAGDLNGDGRPDLAVANFDRDAVSVFLARPNGTFRAAVNYHTDDGPYTVAISDLNLDGRPDLAVANWNAVTVSALLGRGDGSFLPQIRHTEPNIGNILYIAAADLNGDGRPDVAAADESDSVWVMLGHGDGTFGPAARYHANDTPAGVVIADLNEDGELDLAVANVNSSDVSILLGRGDGTFAPTRNYRLEAPYSGTSSAAIADLNGDGRPDIAAANDLTNDVSVALGRGDGSFLPAAHYRTHGSPEAVAVADLNGDTLPDLAIANSDSRDVSVLFQTTATPPRIEISGVPRACLRRVGRVRAQVTSDSALTSVSVFVDRRRIKSTTKTRFTLQLRVTKLRPGRHSLRVTAVNRAHLAATKAIHFRRCTR
jgi:FG-GAP-like repeat